MTLKSIMSNLKEDYITFPLYIISHPFKGFDEMKYENRGKLSTCFVFLVLLCLLNIMKYVYTGFIVNYNNPYYINSIFIVATTVLPIILFVTANWTITTLINGLGKYKEIFLVNMYSLYLTLIFDSIFIVLSNVLTLEEMPIAYFFTSLSTFTYCLYLFIGLIVIHEFTFSKAIGSIILTFISMAIILFVTLLLFSLVGEVAQFIITIIKELSLKYF